MCVKVEGNVSSIHLLASLADLKCFHKADKHEIKNCNLNPSCLIVLFRPFIFIPFTLLCPCFVYFLQLPFFFPTTFVLSGPPVLLFLLTSSNIQPLSSSISRSDVLITSSTHGSFCISIPAFANCILYLLFTQPFYLPILHVY